MECILNRRAYLNNLLFIGIFYSKSILFFNTLVIVVIIIQLIIILIIIIFIRLILICIVTAIMISSHMGGGIRSTELLECVASEDEISIRQGCHLPKKLIFFSNFNCNLHVSLCKFLTALVNFFFFCVKNAYNACGIRGM